ncbi:hypothetical protein TUM12370_14250 [Salmonella enterica subsp. enterica serovar Choleraesuis]|nr:hypothetical protein TUM12370_14250 [Salmonella enterica subsp. enterica serovar Choleraesuis]
MVETNEVVDVGGALNNRLDPLEDLQLLERLHTELSARIYSTHNASEKFRLLALQSEIEAVLEHQ